MTHPDIHSFKNPFEQLVEVMRRLRAEDGCPWDRKQNHETLIKYLREESFEVIEAILKKCDKNLEEELGDLLLQVVFHAQIGSENKKFDMDSIIKALNEKMIYRHPHVFDENFDLKGQSHDQLWESVKAKEKKEKQMDQSSPLPGRDAILRAERIQLDAHKEKFDFEKTSEVVDKIKEELAEVEADIQTGDRTRIKAELGDLLFSCVNLCRFLEINPEEALELTNQKFEDRYQLMKNIFKEEHQDTRFKETSMETKDAYWEKAKIKTQGNLS